MERCLVGGIRIWIYYIKNQCVSNITGKTCLKDLYHLVQGIKNVQHLSLLLKENGIQSYTIWRKDSLNYFLRNS